MSKRSAEDADSGGQSPKRSGRSLRSRGDGSGVPVSTSLQDRVEAGLQELFGSCSLDYVGAVLNGMKKRAKKKTPAQDSQASDLTKYEVWRRYQGRDAADAKFLCFRPQFAVPPLPLTLVSEAFSRFRHDAREGLPEQRDIVFATAFWQKLHGEAYILDHDEEVKRIVQGILSKYLTEDVTAYFNLQGRVEADGLLILKHFIRLVLEFKSQAGSSGDPDFQVLDYFARAVTLQNMKKHRQYSLALCILGPRLEVLGVTMEDGKVWAEPLAETKCYGSDEYLLATARIWRAVRKFVSDYVPMKLVSPPVPWPLEKKTDLKRLYNDKLLFSSKLPDGKRELAKLTSRYSLEAHKAWLPFAPTVIGDEVETAGNYFVVRMEYLSRENGWVSAEEVLKAIQGVPQQVGKLKRCIAAALEVGHSKGFVHGDLRLCNILVSTGAVEKEDGCPRYEVKLCDFDWAGKEGEVVYPMTNPRILWHPDVAYGAKIRKEHDLHFVDNLLEQLLKVPSSKTFEDELMDEL